MPERSALSPIPSTLQQFITAIAMSEPSALLPFPTSPAVDFMRAYLIAEGLPTIIKQTQQEWKQQKAAQWLEQVLPIVETAINAGTADAIEVIKGISEGGKEHLETLGLPPDVFTKLADVMTNRDFKRMTEFIERMRSHPLFSKFWSIIEKAFNTSEAQPNNALPLASPSTPPMSPSAPALHLGGGWQLVPKEATSPTPPVGGEPAATPAPSIMPIFGNIQGGNFFRTDNQQHDLAIPLLALGSFLAQFEGAKPLGALVSTYGSALMQQAEAEREMQAKRELMFREWFLREIGNNLPFMSDEQIDAVAAHMGAPQLSPTLKVIRDAGRQAMEADTVIPAKFLEDIGEENARNIFGEALTTVLKNIKVRVPANTLFTMLTQQSFVNQRDIRTAMSDVQMTLSSMSNLAQNTIRHLIKFADNIRKADENKLNDFLKVANNIQNFVKGFLANPEKFPEPVVKEFRHLAELSQTAINLFNQKGVSLEQKRQALIKLVEKLNEIITSHSTEAISLIEKLYGSPAERMAALEGFDKLFVRFNTTMLMVQSAIPIAIAAPEELSSQPIMTNQQAGNIPPDALLAAAAAIGAAGQSRPPVQQVIVQSGGGIPELAWLTRLLTGKLPSSQKHQDAMALARERISLAWKRFEEARKRAQQASAKMPTASKYAADTTLKNIETIQSLKTALNRYIDVNLPVAVAILKRLYPNGIPSHEGIVSWSEIEAIKDTRQKKSVLKFLVNYDFSTLADFITEKLNVVIKNPQSGTAYTTLLDLIKNPKLKSILDIINTFQQRGVGDTKTTPIYSGKYLYYFKRNKDGSVSIVAVKPPQQKSTTKRESLIESKLEAMSGGRKTEPTQKGRKGILGDIQL